MTIARQEAGMPSTVDAEMAALIHMDSLRWPTNRKPVDPEALNVDIAAGERRRADLGVEEVQFVGIQAVQRPEALVRIEGNYLG